MGGSGSSATSVTEDARVEPGFDEVQKSDPDWTEVAELLSTRSEDYKKMYGYELPIRRIWRVRPCETLMKYTSQAASLGAPTKLFHGTSKHKAEAIIKFGFKLPERKGMFGRGVYFASTPLKSATFAPELSLWPALQRLCKGGIWNAMTQRDEGQMLLCDVYLGRSMTLRSSNNNLDPTVDLQAGWLRKTFGFGDYDSVYAPGGFFGAVNVDEYVVYKEFQGVPRYLIEFEYKHL